MLVTLNSSGAARERIELNSPRYRDSEFDGAYLGHLGLTTNGPGNGAAVGHRFWAGTPAGVAGLKAGTVIVSIGGIEVASSVDVPIALDKFEPGQEVDINVVREGQNQQLKAKLARKPLDVVQPENFYSSTLEMTLCNWTMQSSTPSGPPAQRTAVAWKSGNRF